jgi:hypothetical protein
LSSDWEFESEEPPSESPPKAEGVTSPIEMDGVEVSGGGGSGELDAAAPNALLEEAKAAKPPPVDEAGVAELPNAEVVLGEPNGDGEGAADFTNAL